MDISKKHCVLCMNYYPRNNYWLSAELRNLGVDLTIVGIPESQRKVFFKGKFGKVYQNIYKLLRVLKIWKNCRKDSVIMSMDDTASAVFCAVFLNLLGCKHTVILLNMIDNLSGNSMKTYLYKKAFKNMYASCSNEDILNLYSARFNIDKQRLFLLQDCYSNWGQAILEKKEPTSQGDYIFSGGSSHRDWHLFVEVAKKMPYQKFVGVARKGHFNIVELPENLTMYFDIESTKFSEFLRNCKFVFLPIDIKTQGGQIVIFQAGLYKKAVVSTETVAVRVYIEDGVNGELVAFKDVDNAVEKLTSLTKDQERIDRYSRELFKTIVEFSPENFIKKLMAFIEKI